MKDIKNLFTSGNNDARWEFLRKNQRYFVAVILLVILIVVLAKFTGSSKKQEEGAGTEGTEITAENFVLDKELQVDAVPEVNALVESYYAAYAADDLDTISKLAYPMSDNEKSYIGVYSQYIKNYSNIKCYTKSGLDKGSYLVSAYYELKFYGVKTRAQGLDFFYVETDKDGKLYINNLYSPYNISRTEAELDPAIYSVIIKYGEQEDLVKLGEEVTAKYNEALASDVELATMVSTTIPAAMKEWMASIKKDEDTETSEKTDKKDEVAKTDGSEKTDSKKEESSEKKETDSKKEDSSEKKETDTKKEDSSEKKETDTKKDDSSKKDADTKKDSSSKKTDKKKDSKVTIRTTDNVFVRQEPSTDAEINERAVKGSTFTKISESGGWTKIEYKGGVAYIKSDYVKEVE